MSYFTKSVGKKSNFSDEDTVIQKISIESIIPDKNQVRESFNEEKLIELADSIKECGILNPIQVRLVNDDYIILTGERRFRAAQIVGLELVPCIVHEGDMDEKDIKALQLIENLQREDLSGIETAKGFTALKDNGLTQREIARSLGVSEGAVSEGITVIKRLPPEWLEEIEKAKVKFSLKELYNIAKEKSKIKRQNIYQKLMETVGETVEIEEPEPKQKKNEVNTEFTEDELIKIWEALIKEKRRDIKNLALYITSKKMQSLLKIAEGSGE